MPLDCYDEQGPDARPQQEHAECRPFIGILFECCGVYSRVYRTCDKTAYEGRCPRCGRPVRVRVAPNGVSARLFRAR